MWSGNDRSRCLRVHELDCHRKPPVGRCEQRHSEKGLRTAGMFGYFARMSPGKKRAASLFAKRATEKHQASDNWSPAVVRDRLQQIQDSLPVRSKRALARKLGESERLVRTWLNPNGSLPKSDKLHKIGKQTDVSIDWLLGFDDVPKMRSDRSNVGVLAEALVRHVIEEYSRNRTHFDPLIDQALADLLVGSVWPLEFPMPATTALSVDLRSPNPNLQYRMVVPNPQHFLNTVSTWAVIVATYMASVLHVEDPRVRALYSGLVRQLRSVLPISAEDKLRNEFREKAFAHAKKALDGGGQRARRVAGKSANNKSQTR
jgi:hypothetical protein